MRPKEELLFKVRVDGSNWNEGVQHTTQIFRTRDPLSNVIEGDTQDQTLLAQPAYFNLCHKVGGSE